MNSFPHQRQRVHVLVVCSGLLAAQELLEILRHSSYDIEVCLCTTHDYQPRMLQADDLDFNLIMLDAALSDSYQWCREVRSLGITLPIVFFSTGDTSPEVTQVYSAGGSDYVTTPFSQQEVLSRLKTHLELCQSQRKFNQLFVANPVAMAISTLDDGRLLEVNPAFAELTGYTLDELLGKSTLDLNIWANRDDRNRIVQALLTKQSVRDQEIQGQTRTGELKTVLLSSELIDYEGKTCLFSRAIDITDRKQADIQRQRQLEMYTLLNSVSRQLLNQDPDTAIHFTLKAIGEFTASDRVNIIQMDANQVTFSMTHEWCMEGIEPCIALARAMKPEAYPWIMQQLLTGEPLEIQRLADLPPEARQECDLMREAGVKSTIIVPMVNDATIAGYLSADAVRAERRWMPEDIKLFSLVGELIAIAQARYAAEETQRFYLHAVSHDLRNPVVGMSMIVKNLLNQRANRSASEPSSLWVPTKVLQRMDSSCDRQLHLINSLVEANEVEMWGVTLQPQVVSLNALLEELAETWEPILSDYQASLDCRLSLDLPPVKADASQIWRVLENLLANAIKHNPPGVHITLTTTTATNAGYVRCVVADNGVGIDPNQVTGLFERYRRGTSVSRVRGLGLGLYLCRQIVIAHGGDIGVETSLGHGAKFWFTLPIAG